MVALTIVMALLIHTGSCRGAVNFEKNFMLIGQVFPQECPVQGWLSNEPGFRYILIPTDTDGMSLTIEESRRYVRQYFPRKKGDLFTNFHFVVMPDTNIKPFTYKQITWMKEGFEEHGIGAFVTLGADVSGSYEQEWLSSPLHEVLPTSLYAQSRISGSFTIDILEEDPPILSMFRPFGIEDFTGTSPFSKNSPKEGSTVWADALFPSGIRRAPWLISWKLGLAGGHIWGVSCDLDHQWWWPSGMRYGSTNPYSGDVFLNIVFYSFGRPIPTDISLVHEIRTRFGLYQTQRLMIRGTIEWAERLGANTHKAERALGEVEEIHELAMTQYADGEYEESMNSLGAAMEKAVIALELAYKTKRGAMFYIYVVEWLVTTGALLLSGSVLYTLMIRRRLYRAIDTTRFSRPEE